MVKPKRILFLFILLSIPVYIYLFKVQNNLFVDYTVSDNLIDNIISRNITSEMSEYEKVKAIHDYIVVSTRYDIENLNNDTIPDIDYTAKGVLEKHTGVCRGYAEAFKLLMDRLDIECEILTGTADNISHAWNVVRIDGKWYQIDCTYDDPIDDNNVEGNSNNLRYDYFLVTDAQMYIDHVPDKNSKTYLCVSEDYMYMEKVNHVPYRILESIEYIPSALLKEVDNHVRSVTFYFPDNLDLESSKIIERIAITLGNTGHSFTQFYYTPVAKCGKYYYTTISIE